MPIIRPFRGIIYNKDKVKDLNKVIIPPYDVISSYEQEGYYQSHPYNIIRIILGKEKADDNGRENKYIRAGRYFKEWKDKGVLKKEKFSSIYVYEQEYFLEERKIIRRGFIALMKLDDFNSGVVFPHEQVFSKPQKDRFSLMKNCFANLSPVFSLYRDSLCKVDEYLKKGVPLFELEDKKGVKHRLNVIRDKDTISKIAELMKDKRILIADGHHRYLAFLKLKEESKKNSALKGGWGYGMLYFLNAEFGTASILPVHRLIGNLTPDQSSKLNYWVKELFEVKALPFTSENSSYQLKNMLRQINLAADFSLGMYRGDGAYYVLSLNKAERVFFNRTTSAVVDNLVKKVTQKERLERGGEIDFTPYSDQAVNLVKRRKFQIAFFLKPTSLKEVERVAFSGKVMPPKSSYFYPKLFTGLVMRDIRDAV